MSDEKKLTTESRISRPAPGYTEKEWRIHVEGLVAQTRAAEAEARENGTWGLRMHYGNSPWGDDDTEDGQD